MSRITLLPALFAATLSPNLFAQTAPGATALTPEQRDAPIRDFGKLASSLGNEGNYTKDQIAFAPDFLSRAEYRCDFST